MAKRRVFYSFHYDNDVFRVQQIRNMGVLEGDEPVSANKWETVKKSGKDSIKRWIDDNMKNKSCVVVLVGEETHERPLVKYEIKKAWEDGKGVLGIYIHNLKCPRIGRSRQGKNPFDAFTLGDKSLSSIVKCYNPKVNDAYNDIEENIKDWIEEAIEIRDQY